MISELIERLQFALDNWDDQEVCVVTVTENSPYADTSHHATPIRVELDVFFNGPSGGSARYATIHTKKWIDE